MTKALLVVLFFMHVRYSTRLTVLTALGRLLLAGDPDRPDPERLRDPRSAAAGSGEVRDPGEKQPQRAALGPAPAPGAALCPTSVKEPAAASG